MNRGLGSWKLRLRLHREIHASGTAWFQRFHFAGEGAAAAGVGAGEGVAGGVVRVGPCGGWAYAMEMAYGIC